jgi:hypothetical protein
MGPPFLILNGFQLPLDGYVLIAVVTVETASVRLDELDGIGDQLKVASLESLICFPFLLIQCADDPYASAFVKILFCNFSKLVKAGDLDPVCLFL